MPTTTAKEYLKMLTDYRSEMEKLNKVRAELQAKIAEASKNYSDAATVEAKAKAEDTKKKAQAEAKKAAAKPVATETKKKTSGKDK